MRTTPTPIPILLLLAVAAVLPGQQPQGQPMPGQPMPGQPMPEPQPAKSKGDVLATEMDKMQYAIGVQVARNFLRQGTTIDPELILKGMQDVFGGRRLLLTEKELMMAWQQNTEETRRRQAKDRRATSIDNKQAAESWLSANAKQEGVVTLPSGLQYRILKAGDGPKPTADDTVFLQYRGTLIDGTEFLVSEPDAPAVVPLQGTALIAGLTEALKSMPAGSKWQVFIPPHLGYGERGHGMYVGPNCVLVFEVDLLGIKPPGKDQPAPRTGEPAKSKEPENRPKEPQK